MNNSQETEVKNENKSGFPPTGGAGVERGSEARLRRAARHAWWAAWFIRFCGLFWRVRIEDPEGRLASPNPWILVLWHNRVLATPLAYRKWFSHRRGVVLTSPSGDGEVLARTVAAFGMGAVRGSSSRRGARALRELTGVLKEGRDVIITPDGPRGPRYQVAPGVVALAAMTGVEVLPIDIEIRGYFELGSWDRFRVPWPWGMITLRMREPINVPRKVDEAARDAYCKAIGDALQGDANAP